MKKYIMDRCRRPYKGVRYRNTGIEIISIHKRIYHRLGFNEPLEAVELMLHRYGRGAVLAAIDIIQKVETPIGKSESRNDEFS